MGKQEQLSLPLGNKGEAAEAGSRQEAGKWEARAPLLGWARFFQLRVSAALVKCQEDSEWVTRKWGLFRSLGWQLRCQKKGVPDLLAAA